MGLNSVQKKNKVLSKEVQKELILKELEQKYENERNDLVEFTKMYFKEEKPKGIQEFLVDDYIYIIADHLQQVFEWKINRLIINIPPWHTKTELVSKMFPVWALWKNPHYQVITTWYAAKLTIWFSQESKDIYLSPTYEKVFPRRPELSDKQNTKEHWINEQWGSYYATWTGWPITWKRTNCFVIDDPIRPDDAMTSDLKRIWINNWFWNTVVSRLFNPKDDAIIIIMQRTHEADLCGDLMDKMKEWTWEDYTVLSLPAICEEFEEFETRYWTFTREPWEPLAPSRFNLWDLELIKQSYWAVNFDCQYQQNPIAKWSQEFHEEWFKYYDDIPNEYWRVFTTVDPAFSKKKTADNSVVTTAKIIKDRIYILEQTAWKFDPAELEDQIIYHTKKWKVETIGVESIAAQVTITFSLRRRLLKEELHMTQIEEIRQRDDKWAKIRALIPLYRNWLIFHKRDMEDLENELMKFPRWKRDDRADCLQMLLHLYELMPWSNKIYNMPKVKYNKWGLPVIV